MHIRKLNLVALCVALFGSSALLAQKAPDPLPKLSINELTLSAYRDHKSIVRSSAELKAISHISVTIHNSHTNTDETYSGVRLSDLLTKMGAPLGGELRGKALANYIVATGSDGYKAVIALGEADPSFHPGEILVADTMDGKPLDAHSGPFKLVAKTSARRGPCGIWFRLN